MSKEEKLKEMIKDLEDRLREKESWLKEIKRDNCYMRDAIINRFIADNNGPVR